jgi:hypothetical protein
VCRFHLHRIFNAVGLILATAAVIIAWVKFDVHKVLGVVIIVLGWLQPANAFFRPKKPSVDPMTGKAEKRSKLRIVWELLHKVSGYLALLLALITILTGLHVIREFNTIESDTWRNAYIGVAIVLAILWVAGVVFAFVMHRRKRRQQGQRNRESALPDGKYMERTSSEVDVQS